MSYTISANYRNRKSEYKWLVRKTDEPVEKAIAVKTVTAKKVRFSDSNRIEEGFGCKVVAITESAVWTDAEKPAPVPAQIYFDYTRFVNPLTGNMVRETEELRLAADGSMMALLPAS